MIYTRTGDSGTTDLANGKRCLKTDERMEAVGSLDELNAHLGLLLSHLSPELADALSAEATLIVRAQRILFAIGAQVVMTHGADTQPDADDVKALEEAMDGMNHRDGIRFDGFRLPGGCPAAAEAHVARCVCRRAERQAWRLGRGNMPELSLIFLNRLSDFLFLLSRKINVLAGTEEKKVEKD